MGSSSSGKAVPIVLLHRSADQAVHVIALQEQKKNRDPSRSGVNEESQTVRQQKDDGVMTNVYCAVNQKLCQKVVS
jgi:hypothetical protein